MSSKAACSIFTAMIMALVLASSAFAQDPTPEEIVAKVREAADFIAQNGQAGLAEFNDPNNSRWVSNGIYIVFQDCEANVVASHPFKPAVIGSTLDKMVDVKGNAFGFTICDAGMEPNGAWVEYWFPKPGETTPSRKLSYNKQAAGTSLVATGGLYSDTLNVDELNAMLK